MRRLDKRLTLLLLAMTLASCPPPENSCGGDVETYMVTYEIEYSNKTGMDIDLLSGAFVSPSENPIVFSNDRFTLKKNSAGSFTVSWPYTWYFYVREACPEFTERGDAISSFYLQLLVNEQDYMIAGWPEEVYSRDNIVSYGQGYGLDAGSIAILHNGELQVFVFDDPTHLTDQNIEVTANLEMNYPALKGGVSDFSSKNLSLDRKLSILRGFIPRNLGIGKNFALKGGVLHPRFPINDTDSFVFEITEFPHRR